jgi:acyl dehydratase
VPDRQEIDKRWLMAYSAGLGEMQYPHPLFPVCYEWPVSRPIRQIDALREHYGRLVHAEHDLTLHRAARDGDRLEVSVRVAAVVQKKPGAIVVFRFETRDAAGAPVSTTNFTALYRGVSVEGADRGSVDSAPELKQALSPAGEIQIGATAAHVYTECARIWNPIHTDREYARAAGLPDIILHGTATLALSVSRILEKFKVIPGDVRRVRCRFAGMVLMPSRLSVHASHSENRIEFETRNERGEAVIQRGSVKLDDHAA